MRKIPYLRPEFFWSYIKHSEETKKRKTIFILSTIAVFACVLIIKNHLGQNIITKPDFTIVLKESIYIEYGLDVYRDDTLLNIIE